MDESLIIPHQSHTSVPDCVPVSDGTAVQSWLRSKRSPHTRKAYLRDIEAFYDQVNKPIGDVRLPDLQDFADWLRIEYPDITTQRRMLYAVKSLFTFAQKQGYIPFNVGTGVTPPKGKDTLAERILSLSQIQNVIYEAKKSNSKRDYVLILLLYASGVRCEEICNLQWKDCKENGETGQITVFGKERETRAILLHKKAWDELQSLRPAGASADDYVFASRQSSVHDGVESYRLTEARVWQVVTTIAEKAGIHASPHFFRHAHATQAMKKVPQRIIQQTMGWKSPLTMMKYQHVMPDESSSLALEL